MTSSMLDVNFNTLPTSTVFEPDIVSVDLGVLADEPAVINTTYSNSLSDIVKVVSQSDGACEQHISFECDGATLGFTSNPGVANLTGWHDINGDVHGYWGAGLPSSGCMTGRTRSNNAGILNCINSKD